MGNKVGFQANNQKVKLAYVEEDVVHITFIQNLKSKYLCSQLEYGKSKIFLFQCSISQFLSYHTSQNVLLLRKQYHSLLHDSQLMVRTNRETISILKQNKQLQIALRDIFMKQFKLQHMERIQNLVTAMHILANYSQQFYRFKNCFSITQLHNFNASFVQEKELIKNLPEKFVLIVLRNGVTAYQIESDKKTQRINGSIIGQKTILSILKFKYPNFTTQECFDLAFSSGNLRQVDLMVQDIYGKNLNNLGLPGDIIASSLAKIAKLQKDQLKNVQPADIIRSIITVFAINSANLTGLFLEKSNFQNAVILADSFHNDKFYSLLQSICAITSPGKTILFANHSPFMACLGTAFTNKGSQE